METKKEVTTGSFLLMVCLTIFLSACGFALLHFNLVAYGFTLFILVPLLIGYFLGQRPDFKISSFISILFGIVAFVYLLFTAQLEGMFCIVTLLPLIILLVYVGSVIGWAIRSEVARNKRSRNDLRLSIFPLLILLFGGVIEHYFVEAYDYNEVISKIYLPYEKETVFDYIKSVDTLYTEKPILMKLGLSVPERCELEKEEVGGKRTCYFREGKIEEEITKIKRGEILQMKILNYGLPGRKWLKFIDATYLFEAKGNGTVMTRITSYRTELKPRIYWKFWEEKAIQAEHKYVFNDLSRRLSNK